MPTLIRTVQREIMVAMTPEELEELASNIADKCAQADELRARIAEQSAPLKRDLKLLEKERFSASESRRSGKTKRLVECEEMLVGDRVQVFRAHELVDDRPATDADRQLVLGEQRPAEEDPVSVEENDPDQSSTSGKMVHIPARKPPKTAVQQGPLKRGRKS